jgi:hypothetical protein
MGKGAPKDQDCRRLGKGRVVAKDLRISHPINASIKNHIGNNTVELITYAKII